MNHENEIDLKRLILALRRRFSLVLSITAGFFLLALLYLFIATPQYTAETLLFLDRSITQTVSENSSVKNMAFETAAIESEVEVIRSRGMTDAVMEKLKTKSYFQDALKEGKEKNDIAKKILRALDVHRMGETYVLSIRYSAEDPQEASDIANAYADTYVAEQLNITFEISSRTISWLQLKIDELGRQSIEAQKKAIEYRKKYNEAQLGLKNSEETTQDKTTTSDEIGLAKFNNLQKEANTYKALYESFLERLETLNMEQSYPVTETRVITKATPPRNKSHPVAIVILGVGLILGAGTGILTALLADNFDKTLRRGGQIKRDIGVPFLGFFPERKKGRKSLSFASASGKAFDVEMDTHSIDDPFSLQSETIRTIRHSIDARAGSDNKRVIGVVSAEQGEGKAIVASNLALYTAQFANTLLLDADIRFSSRKKSNGHDRKEKGLEEMLLGKASLKEAVLHSTPENISILPSLHNDVAQTLAFLDSKRVGNMIDECKKQYDYIIVEFPPLISSADVYSFAQTVDSVVVVAEWGKTLPNNLNFHLRQNGIESDKILGVVLENANMKKMKKFYGHKTYS